MKKIITIALLTILVSCKKNNLSKTYFVKGKGTYTSGFTYDVTGEIIVYSDGTGNATFDLLRNPIQLRETKTQKGNKVNFVTNGNQFYMNDGFITKKGKVEFMSEEIIFTGEER